MEKLPCKDCGALILPATAESTGGICMACKQRLRQGFEKARAKAPAEHDPARKFWLSLVTRASDDPSLTSFSSSERTYFTVSLLELEVYDGGFEQFFFNSSGSYYEDAAAGLAELGASSALGLLRQASEAIFGGSPPPEDRSERWQIMYGKPHLPSSRVRQEMLLDRLDRQYCEDPDNLGDLLKAYAEAHNLLEPFKR